MEALWEALAVGGGAKATALLFSLALVLGASALPEGAATADGSDGSGLAVRDAASGEALWRTTASADRPFRGVAADARLVVATAAECTEEGDVEWTLTSFDARTGRTRWTAPGLGVATKTAFWSQSGTVPVSASGVVVVGGGRFVEGVRGLDAGTGRERWSMPVGYRELGVSETLLFSAEGPGEAPVLVARRRRNGRELWSFPVNQQQAWSRTFDVVAADRDTIVVANGDYLTRYGDEPGSATTFFVLDARTGVERTRFVDDDPTVQFTDFQMTSDSLVFVEAGSAVIARDLADGTVLWRHEVPVPDESEGSHATAVSMVASSESATALVNVDAVGARALDTATGELLWQRSDAEVLSAGGGQAYLDVAGAGKAEMVDARSGRVQWRGVLPQRRAPQVVKSDWIIAGGRLVTAGLCDTE